MCKHTAGAGFTASSCPRSSPGAGGGAIVMTRGTVCVPSHVEFWVRFPPVTQDQTRRLDDVTSQNPFDDDDDRTTE